MLCKKIQDVITCNVEMKEMFVYKMETMTTEEMQRFLNREAEKGSSEYEALKALVEILGIEFPELKREAE